MLKSVKLYITKINHLMKENGIKTRNKDMEFKNGQMDLPIKDFGLMIKHMVQENLFIQTEQLIMEVGKMIKHQVLEYLFIHKNKDMKENGKTIYKMGMVKSFFLMEINIKGILKQEINMDLVKIYY